MKKKQEKSRKKKKKIMENQKVRNIRKTEEKI
jgi:hypothetical protein